MFMFFSVLLLSKDFGKFKAAERKSTFFFPLCVLLFAPYTVSPSLFMSFFFFLVLYFQAQQLESPCSI